MLEMVSEYRSTSKKWPARAQIREEWNDVAVALAEQGFHVLQPDLHTNPKTKPGVLGEADFVDLIKDLVRLNEHVPQLPARGQGGGVLATVSTRALRCPQFQCDSRVPVAGLWVPVCAAL